MRKLMFLSCLCILGYSCGGGLGDTNVHRVNYDINVGKRSAPYLTEQNHQKGWGKSNCLGCHQDFKHSMATPDLSAKDYQGIIDKAVSKVGESNAINVCSACHGLNGVTETESGKKAKRDCLVCHDNMDKLHFYKNSTKRSYFHDFNGNGKLDDEDCVVCHYQPDMDGILEPETDLAPINGEPCYRTNDLCLNCHSHNVEIKADTNGDGTGDKSLMYFIPDADNVAVTTQTYSSDVHGGGSSGGNSTFKGVTLGGKLLFHSNESPLLCVDCHNPHASNNYDLIVERVGETLSTEKLIDQSGNLKYAIVDPESFRFFNGLSYDGYADSYDMSNKTSFDKYVYLPIENNETSIDANRKTLSSLCAACHSGKYKTDVNGLSLPVGPNHGYGHKCSFCHTHGKIF